MEGLAERPRGRTAEETASLTYANGQPNGNCDYPSVSSTGPYVAFACSASNMVASDTNGADDVFVRDIAAQTTERVSVSSDEVQANGRSRSRTQGSISADGRYVVFESDASNLVAGDTGMVDIFVRDRTLGTTERVSVNASGGQASGSSTSAAISADGNFVAFLSDATDLVADAAYGGPDTNGKTDVFVRDLVNDMTYRVSLANDGAEANGNSGTVNFYDDGHYVSISDDGRYVAFQSGATNLVAGDTNGGGRRLRARPADRQNKPGLGADGRLPGGQRFGVSDPLRRWAVRRLPFVAEQPGCRRHQRQARRLRP